MKISKEGIDLIKLYEGLRLKPYLCPKGVATIGYGSTFYENGKKVTLKDPSITKETADQLFFNTITTYEKGVLEHVKIAMTQGQFDALVSFAYNFGVAKFASSTLLKMLNAGDLKGASEQFYLWVNVIKDGKPAVENGLVKRRAAEKALFLKS